MMSLRVKDTLKCTCFTILVLTSLNPTSWFESSNAEWFRVCLFCRYKYDKFLREVSEVVDRFLSFKSAIDYEV